MADYTRETWEDDNPGVQAGTLYTADRMNNLEEGVEDAAQHHKSGTLAARPAAAAANKNWLYFATDVLRTYLSDGAAWTKIAGEDAGMLKTFAGYSVPAAYFRCNGAAASRTNYPDLFEAVTLTQSCTRVNASPNLTVAAAYDLPVGAVIEGTGIPVGTTILSHTDATHVVMSANASSAGTSTLRFLPWGAGDGSTTFNLPDLRGRALVGWDRPPGATAGTARLTANDEHAGVGGAEKHGLSTAELPAHLHGAGTLATDTEAAHTHGMGYGNAIVALNGSGNRVATAGQDVQTAAGGSHAHDVTGSTANTGSGTDHNNMQPFGIVGVLIKT